MNPTFWSWHDSAVQGEVEPSTKVPTDAAPYVDALGNPLPPIRKLDDLPNIKDWQMEVWMGVEMYQCTLCFQVCWLQDTPPDGEVEGEKPTAAVLLKHVF